MRLKGCLNGTSVQSLSANLLYRINKARAQLNGKPYVERMLVLELRACARLRPLSTDHQSQRFRRLVWLYRVGGRRREASSWSDG